MKRSILASLSITLLVVGCAILGSKTAFQSISATETAVILANKAYLDSVVTGAVKTNGVPVVEAAFNDTQLALHAAAAVASGGNNAPVPPTALAKATAFTNTITANSIKP